VIVIALAAAAALLFALGTVLQQRAAVREPSGGPRGAASLLLRLARRPVWIGGILADGLDDWILHLVLDWHLYALLAVGYTSMTLSEVSLQIGVLAPAIATASIFDPITSVALGVTLFEESLHDDAAGVAASIVALAVMFAGLAVLARSEGARHKPDAPDGTAPVHNAPDGAAPVGQ
jgi:hypothetical protein